MSAVDLSLLPPPEVIETLSFEALLAAYKADLLGRHPDIADVIDLESETTVKLLEVGAYRELQLRARLNDEARALLLAHSTGADLDHIGITYYDGEQRLTISPGDPAAVPPVPPGMEKDEDYRYRLVLKQQSYSVAGPRAAYEFHALSASGQVKSVKVTSPYGGTTQVYVLSRSGNGVPDTPLLTTVDERLSDETIRPLSEEVLVSPAEVVEYTLDVDLILFPGPAGEIVRQASYDSLVAFGAANHRLKTDIVDSAIKSAAHKSGVKKVIVNSPPADIVCGPGQAPWCIGVNVRIAGIES